MRLYHVLSVPRAIKAKELNNMRMSDISEKKNTSISKKKREELKTNAKRRASFLNSSDKSFTSFNAT